MFRFVRPFLLVLLPAVVLVVNPALAEDYCGACRAPCNGLSPGTPCGPVALCVSSIIECPGGGCLPGDCPRQCYCLEGGVFDWWLDPPMVITDGDAGGLFIDIPVPPDWPGPDPLPFEGVLNVGLAIDHTAIGDLFVAIGHGRTGVVLMDRPGRQSSGSGCLADLSSTRPIYFADGPNPIECGTTPSECQACFPMGQVPAGVYAPNQSLGAFQGQMLGGTWRLFIADMQQPNAGVIRGIRLVASRRQPGETSVPAAAPEETSWGTLKVVYR